MCAVALAGPSHTYIPGACCTAVIVVYRCFQPTINRLHLNAHTTQEWYKYEYEECSCLVVSILTRDSKRGTVPECAGCTGAVALYFVGRREETFAHTCATPSHARLAPAIGGLFIFSDPTDAGGGVSPLAGRIGRAV